MFQMFEFKLFYLYKCSISTNTTHSCPFCFSAIAARSVVSFTMLTSFSFWLYQLIKDRQFLISHIFKDYIFHVFINCNNYAIWYQYLISTCTGTAVFSALNKIHSYHWLKESILSPYLRIPEVNSCFDWLPGLYK